MLSPPTTASPGRSQGERLGKIRAGWRYLIREVQIFEGQLVAEVKSCVSGEKYAGLPNIASLDCAAQ